MVDSLSRSPSPINTSGQVSYSNDGAGTLGQGSASRSQSPGATSLVARGRNVRSSPGVQQDATASPPRASQTGRSTAPSPTSSRSPSVGRDSGRELQSFMQGIANEVNGPGPRQAFRIWQQQGSEGELRGLAANQINSVLSGATQSVNLSGMRLTSLPDGLGRLLPGLRKLELQNNQLTSMAALAGMHELRHLDISHNSLTSLSSLPSLRSLEILLANDNPFHAPHDSLQANTPRLIGVALTEAQRAPLFNQLFDRMAAEDDSDDGDDGESVSVSTNSVAGLADQQDYQSPISEAASRWGGGRPKPRAEQQAILFYRAVMPYELHLQLQTDPASRSLLTLAAGMVFTADNDPENDRPLDATSTASRTTLKADLQYLSDAKDSALLSDCQSAADSAVNRCGDRVGYGATQLHQVIEAHQFKAGVLSAKALFEGKARHFNQSLVEAKAAEIAGKTMPGESVEYYQDLAGKVVARGRPLVEASTSSLYGRNFTVTDRQLQETLDLIDAKHSNPAYLDTFKEHEATVNDVLRGVFASDYAHMVEQRSALEATESDAMFDPQKSPAEQADAARHLEALGRREGEWFAKKLPELLSQPELLKSLK